MRVRHQVTKAIRDFFDNNGFTLIDSPIFTGNAVEGTTTLFEVDYFERSAYLTQSGQLYQEAGATAFGKTYCFGPTFRAEKSKTRRHLTEFWMVEPEIAFANLDDNADLAEDLLRHVTQHVLDHCEQDLAFFNDRIDSNVISRLEQIANSPFERMEYSEAINILEQSGQTFDFPVSWGRDLQSEHERYLAEQHVGRPVILMNYPKAVSYTHLTLPTKRIV